MPRFSKIAAFASLAAAAPALSQSAADRPWLLPNRILIIDPYQANSVNWDRVATDPAVKAVIHRAFFGLTPDIKYEERTAAARAKGLLVGLYLLGRPGDPIKQADALVAAGLQSGVKLLALDIENMDPARSMTIADAARFISRVHERTGRYPVFYTNFSTYQHISRTYDQTAVFARTPLWLARFRNSHGMQDQRVWPDYTIWQFQSELNCRPRQQCAHRVPGTASDMDVNVFRGSEADLRALFDPT